MAKPLPLIALFLAASGCGTMANLDGRRLALLDLPRQEPPTVFGGVQRDFRWMTNGGEAMNPAALVFLADLPLSLIGDVLTLPEVIRRRNDPNWGPWTLVPPPEPAAESPPSSP